jgi:hypothetical protein
VASEWSQWISSCEVEGFSLEAEGLENGARVDLTSEKGHENTKISVLNHHYPDSKNEWPTGGPPVTPSGFGH